MSKKVLVFSVLLFLMVAGLVQSVSADTIPITNQMHIVLESIGDPETVDPAWAYDTSSAGLIFQVYDTLINLDEESTSEFVPGLATEWTISPDGMTYTFKIRENVKFHDGSIMTTEDVEYSIEHILVQDRSGGPEWMFFEPLFGVYHNHHLGTIKNPDGTPGPDAATVGHMLDDAVERNGTHVWFNLYMAYPPFMQILSQSWGSILNKDFCVAHGDWPGWDITYTEWVYYDDPPTAPLDVAGFVMCGTGPFMGPPFSDPDFGSAYWTHGVEWSIVRFKDYWGGWPDASSSGYANRITEKVVYEWGTRLADFRAGTADNVYVPTSYIYQVSGWPGIRGMRDLPRMLCDGMFFNFDIGPTTTYAGSQQLDGNGIPLDFFSDVNVRKSFAHAFEYDRYLAEVLLGEADQPPSPHIRGLAYDYYIWDGGTTPNGTVLDPVPKYYYDLAKVAEYMQAASADAGSPAYGVWDIGFKMTITYNAGNVPRMTAATMLKENMAKVNAKFDITTTPVTWSTYLGELWYYPTFKSIMPLYIIGWLADYPDPHNFVMPFQHTYGDFASPSSYSNPTVDALIEAGIAETDLDNARPIIYHQVAMLYYEDCPSVCLDQPLVRRWERDWVQGYVFNAIWPMTYYRYLWKGLDGDIDFSNAIDILDLGKISAHWYDPPVAGPDDYNRMADIAPYYQYQSLAYGPDGFHGPVPYPSVALVDLWDAAMVNANWGNIKG